MDFWYLICGFVNVSAAIWLFHFICSFYLFTYIISSQMTSLAENVIVSVNRNRKWQIKSSSSSDEILSNARISVVCYISFLFCKLIFLSGLFAEGFDRKDSTALLYLPSFIKKGFLFIDIKTICFI